MEKERLQDLKNGEGTTLGPQIGKEGTTPGPQIDKERL